MSTNEHNLIVSPGAGGGSTVHHHDFPEVRAEGETPHEAAEQLLNHLCRALDSALLEWRRQEIERALDDVRAFVGASKP
jgi:hypothetical protein